MIEFIAGLYTFNFWLEFLIVPFVVLLGVLIAFTQNEEKHQQIHKLLKRLSLYVGILIFLCVVEHVINNSKDYWKLAYLKQFLLPIELSLCFIPFLYLLALYTKYEDALALLHFKIKPKKLYGFARMQVMLKFKHDYVGLERWKLSIARQPPKSKEEVLRSIAEVKLMQLHEKNPPEVDIAEGWSPFKAKDFLQGNQLETKYYIHYYDDEWGAISSTLKLDNSFLGNDLLYSICGDRNIVKELKLRLSVFDKKNVGNSHETLLMSAISLYNQAFGKPLPGEFIDAIKKGRNFSFKNNVAKVTSKKETFGNSTNGYYLYFTINHI